MHWGCEEPLRHTTALAGKMQVLVALLKAIRETNSTDKASLRGGACDTFVTARQAA